LALRLLIWPPSHFPAHPQAASDNDRFVVFDACALHATISGIAIAQILETIDGKFGQPFFCGDD
jgi:hypothetical protein